MKSRFAVYAAVLIVAVFLSFFMGQLVQRANDAAQKRPAVAAVAPPGPDTIAQERKPSGALIIHLDRGVAPSVLGDGWSGPEPGLGVWSQARAATLRLGNLPPGKPVTLKLTLQAFVAPGHPLEHVRVRAGSQVLANWTLNSAAVQPLDLTIPAGAQSPPGQAQLTLELPDADAPARFTNGSKDTRLLAINLKTIEIPPGG